METLQMQDVNTAFLNLHF